MRVTIQDCKLPPVRIQSMLEALTGLGTATISNRTPNKQLQKLSETGWQEISEDRLEQAAKEHMDIWYKTSSHTGQRKRIYARVPVVIVI